MSDRIRAAQRELNRAMMERSFTEVLDDFAREWEHNRKLEAGLAQRKPNLLYPAIVALLAAAIAGAALLHELGVL